MALYDGFKARLATLCERGAISKDVKKKFCGALPDDAGELIFEVCSRLFELFETSAKGSAEYAAVAQAVTELICSVADTSLFSREVDVLRDYIALTVRCNGSGAPDDFKILSSAARRVNESLQNIKYGLPIFDLRSDDGK